MQAENRGFHSRRTDNYFEEVLAKIVELLREQKEQASESDALNNYLSAFYFNAGFQRLIFAAERLLAAFVGVYCGAPCNEAPMVKDTDRTNWHVLVNYAQCRLKHPHFDSSLPNLRKMLWCASNGKKYRCEPDDWLVIFRDRVNSKKHGSSGTTGKKPKRSDGKDWLPIDQMKLAVHGFGIVSEAYSEVVAWNPTPKKQ